MRRLRPRQPKGETVHQLPAPTRVVLTDEEARAIARGRARVDLPTKDRDFIEIWGASGERQKKKGKRRA